MGYLKLENLQDAEEFIIKKCEDENFKEETKTLYNDLKEEYDNKVKEGDSTRYSFTNDTTCIVYALEPIVKQGYIWKSSSLKKHDLYRITLVREYPHLKKKRKDTEQFYQHGLGYSSNIVTTQFPLTSYPIELSKELESKLKLVRESYLTESEDETDITTETSTSNTSIHNYSEFADADTDDSEEIVLRKKKMV